MKLTLAAIGRMKAGPERELVERYTKRIAGSGRAAGVTGFGCVESVESRAGSSELRKREEADALMAMLPAQTPVVLFDERGQSIDSRRFAKLIGDHADAGTTHLGFLIGGPDGLDATLRDTASRIISFGKLTMPHQLARILAAEQIYRAVTILTHHPYHRD